MFTKDSEIRIYVPNLLHKAEEASLIKDFSDNHSIPYSNIKILSNNSQNISKKIETQIKETELDDGEFNVYSSYLKDKNYNKALFQKLDSEISLEADYLFKSRSNYKLKYISAYNLTSYGEIVLDFESYYGTVGIFSRPSNFGGKSNLYKLIQILLWGKYLSLDEYSTLPSLFNDYIEDDYAYIEGTLELNEKSFFIRRELKRETKKRIKHNLFVYEISDRSQADRYIYIFDNHLKDVRASDYQPSLPDGMWVKTLNKNQLDLFHSEIGKIEDFVKICLFNQNTLYDLILTKKTERTRNFYNLFGGAYYEKKKNIAKEKYSKFKKKSSLHTVELSTLQAELATNENQLESSERDLSLLETEISILKETISTLEKEKNDCYNSLKPIESVDVNYKKKLHLELESELKDLDNEIFTLQAKIELNKTLEQYNLNDLKEQNKEHIEYLSSLSEDKELKKEIIALETELLEMEKDLSLEDEKLNSIKNKKQDVKQKFHGNRDKIAFYSKQLDEIPEDLKCNKCGSFVISYNDKRKDINDNIKILKDENKKLKDSAEFLLDEEKAIQESKSGIIALITFKRENIRHKKDKLENSFRLEKLKITNKINENNEIQQKLDDHLKNKEKLQNIQQSFFDKKNLLEKLTNELESFKEKNEETLTFNDKVKEEINILDEKLGDKKDILSFQTEKRGGLLANVETYKKNITLLSTKISSFKEEIEMDKAFQFYIETHDMNGIIKHMIKSYLPVINQELKSLTEHMNFKVEIYLDQGKYINYNFIRDGKSRDLKNVSGCEGYIALTALYLVHIKFSKVSLPNIVLFDEVFQISDENVENMYEILKLYGEIFDHVFMIWHGSGLEEMVDHAIYVEKENNISKILN